MSAHRPPQPWPMKWVVVAIIVVLIPYTYLTLHYRKPGPAFRPYEDTKNRATTIRLLSTGYQRIALDARRPADLLRPAAATETAPGPGGLPAVLSGALIDQPVLPLSIDSVFVAGVAATAQPYSIEFTCTLADNKTELAGGQLYRREGELVVVPSFEPLGGGLLARNRESTVLLTVPAGALKPGSYAVTLVGARTSRRWTLQVH